MRFTFSNGELYVPPSPWPGPTSSLNCEAKIAHVVIVVVARAITWEAIYDPSSVKIRPGGNTTRTSAPYRCPAP